MDATTCLIANIYWRILHKQMATIHPDVIDPSFLIHTVGERSFDFGEFGQYDYVASAH
jgi:hypothetical protein